MAIAFDSEFMRCARNVCASAPKLPNSRRSSIETSPRAGHMIMDPPLGEAQCDCLPNYLSPNRPSRHSYPSLSFVMSDYPQRERSRSPRRRPSRSPRRARRSYSPRSRSRSRGDRGDRDEYRRPDRRSPERRSRSPLSNSGAAGPSGSPYGGRSGYPPARFEDRTVAKENMMQTVRDSSQQDRRVYVGNLSYDVKWHHLKDFMRQGEQGRCNWG